MGLTHSISGRKLFWDATKLTASPNFLWVTQSISLLHSPSALHPASSCSGEDLSIRNVLLLLHAVNHIHRYVDRMACAEVAAQY